MKLPESEIAVNLKQGGADPTAAVTDPATWPRDDVIQPFMIEATGLNGRYVRLGETVDGILKRHDLPEAAATLLGEFLALAVGLAAALKYDGIFTLQTKSDGLIPMMVADITSAGEIRGYAQLKEDTVDNFPSWDDVAAAPVPKLLGDGYVAFTVDFSTSTERYQGIVSLDGAHLSDVIRHYFEQSAQFTAAVHLASGKEAATGIWRAGALIVQHLPEDGGSGGAAFDEDGWRRAVTLMQSASRAEFLDPNLSPNDLLFRLFNEDGVRVFEPRSVSDTCRCSEEKMLNALVTLNDSEIDHVLQDGKVEMTCEFCNITRKFTKAQINDSRG